MFSNPTHNPRLRLRARAARFATVFLLTFLSGVPWAVRDAGSQSLDSKIESQKDKLKQIQRDIDRHRAKSKELRREEANVVKQLSHVDREISLSSKLLAGLEERENLLEQKIDSLRANVSIEGQVLEHQRRKLSDRVRQMYKRGANYRWEVILASPDIQDALRRYKFLRIIAERDARLVREVSDRKSALETEQAALTETMADVVALKASRLEEDKKLKEIKKARVSMLKRIRGEKSKHVQAIEELKKSQEKLRNLIERLEEKRLAGRDEADVPAGEFARLKGKLLRPVQGKITKKFGRDRHPKFGTVTFNNGVNIKAPAGAPIRAVAAGTVEFVDWISGYGNCIILNHGGGYYTLYAHTAGVFVKPGQKVSQRDVIAEVGDSGSLNGYECHFEIRKSKEALDPMQWFAK